MIENNEVAVSKKESFGEILVQFIKFGIVGVSNTIVSGVIYFVFNQVLFPGVWLLASVISWLLSVLWAFMLQNVFVFKEDKTEEHRIWWKTLMKTYTAYAFTGLFLNNVLLFFWVNIIDLAQYCGPVISFFDRINVGFLGDPITFSSNMGWVLNMIVSIPLNFVINKFWAYRQKKQ
ncbi:MAG: GtrA family protein [Eubacteriales bacterium]|nr:GtrA family protein [Eubacteriales bacterium]